MINLDAISRTGDPTVSMLVSDAAVSGDWSLVEHFMLGNAGSALPDAYRDDNQAL